MYHLVNKSTGQIVGVCAGKNYLQHESKEIIVIEGDADKNLNYYDVQNLTASGLLSIEPQQANEPDFSGEVKAYLLDRRLQKLKQSDWTQFADSPLSDTKKAEWATYRQALRDLPQQYPDAITNDDIIWPTKPR